MSGMAQLFARVERLERQISQLVESGVIDVETDVVPQSDMWTEHMDYLGRRFPKLNNGRLR